MACSSRLPYTRHERPRAIAMAVASVARLVAVSLLPGRLTRVRAQLTAELSSLPLRRAASASGVTASRQRVRWAKVEASAVLRHSSKE
ncbi:hypothetical protein D3C87_2050230 [compost metagenome]